MDPSCLVSTAQASGGGVPLPNLQQLHDAIVSARTNIPVECFRLVESMPRRILADLEATGVQPSTRWVYLINWQLLGVAFLGIGLWAWSEKGVLSNISSITDLGGFDPVWLFLVVGGVMFILGFAGCIGALRENSFLLKFFSVFLGIIFFLELTAGVLAFVFKDWIKDQLNFFINNNIRAYRDDIDLQNLIDFTQEYWECCGAFGADDWNLNIYFNCTDSNPSREKCGVPFSCCTKDPAEDVINTQCGYDIRAKAVSEQRTFIYIKGCVPQFEKWLQDNLTVVAGIFIGIALLQIFGICLAQNLVSDIEVVRESCLFT
ncbi:tetraspanin-5 isoform X1 [Oncorhynchus tshawytscha]|uniref:Tetraspanin n=1 Tax=Oncorhynchus tshawytscha TaxID=74940 RepID=A0A8C8ELQ2_ONCTS|nr:tetraspanin-5 isoform X1 [Oncorhynchus tshawytscha]